MKYLLLVTTFFAASIFSTITDPFSLNIATGYREDNFSFRVLSDTSENSLIYREKYKHDRFFINKISMRNLYRDFYFFMYFTGSYLFDKTMDVKDSIQENIYSFDYRAKGYDLETAIEIGYAVNLTPYRYYQCVIIPILGYSGFWKNRKRENPIPNPLIEKMTLSNIEIFSSLQRKKLNQKWYGIYLGFISEITPNKKVKFNLGYNFNFLKLKLKFESYLEKNVFDLPNTLVDKWIEIKKMDDEIKSCYAHKAIAGMEYNLTNQLSAGLMFDYKYFISDKGKGDLNIQIEEKKDASQITKAKVFSRWWYFSTMINLLYRF